MIAFLKRLWKFVTETIHSILIDPLGYFSKVKKVTQFPTRPITGPLPAPVPTPQGITLLPGLSITSIPSGNSSWIDYSDDSKTLYQANEETNNPPDNENAIDIRNLSLPVFIHQDAREGYEWGVSQKSGVVIFTSSITSGVTRKDPSTWNTLWSSRSIWLYNGLEPSHSPGKTSATDGTYVYLPNGGIPGALIVVDAATGGSNTNVHVNAPDNWGVIDHRLILTTFSSHTYCLVLAHSWMTNIYAPNLSDGGAGTLSGVVYYKIAPVDGNGKEGPVGLEASITLGTNRAVALIWPGIGGGNTYKIYRGTTPGGENTFFTTSNNYFTDTGAVGTAGTPAATATTAPGGLYIFDVTTPTSPTYVGKIAGDAGSFAVSGSIVFRTQFSSVSMASDTFEGWSISTPSAPTHSFGTLTVPGENVAGTGFEAYGFGTIDINAGATRLFSGYSASKYGNGQPTINAPAGWVILDITGANPAILASQSDGSGHPRGQSVSLGVNYMSMGTLRLSPDGTKVAVSAFNFGVVFWSLSGDTATLASQFPTSGECKDVQTDTNGNFYIPSEQAFYEFTRTGVAGGFLWEVQSSYGGFVPFKDGRFLVPGLLNNGARVYDFSGGPGSNIIYNTGLNIGRAFDIAYDPATQLLYASQAGGGPSFQVLTVGSAPSYPLTGIGDNSGDAATQGHDFRGICAPFTVGAYTLVAQIGQDLGLAVWDVTGNQGGATSTPTRLYLESVGFGGNGRFMHAVYARGYIYAACNSSFPTPAIPTYAKNQGDGGLRVYQVTAGTPPTITFVANYHLNGTWIDVLNNPKTGTPDFLIFNSYSGGAGDGNVLDGVYVMDIRTTPNDPQLIIPATRGLPGYGNGWRTRVIHGSILKVDLGGLEVFTLQVPGYP
jgi:hypothetical protein